jgi:hypothetical protein
MLFSNCQHTFKFFLGFLVWCHSLTGAGIWVQNGGPGFHPPWHCVTRSSDIKFCIGSKDQWWLLSLSLCVPLSAICGTEGEGGGANLDIAKPFNSCHYTAFVDG